MPLFSCLLCGGSQSNTRYQHVPDRFQGFAGEFDYVTCASCGLVQLNPIPENLGQYYKGYPIHTGESALYRVLRRAMVGNCYLAERGDGRKMLDIGCGNGSYLLEMRERGWDISGYEFDPAYAKELSARINAPVIAGLDELEQHQGEFDLITFNFSFEHLDQPLKFLDVAKRALRPGGRLYIAVPNIESREAEMFKERWFHLDPPRHVSFFTKRHLNELLDKLGFESVETKNLPVPTGFAGSMSYRLANKFNPLAWYAGIVPGLAFSRVFPDGNFAVTARLPA